MIGDPIAEIGPAMLDLLKEVEPLGDAHLDIIINNDVRWRPHLFEVAITRGWYFHFGAPEGDNWMRRAMVAKNTVPTLTIGVAASPDTLAVDDFLLQCIELDAAIVSIGVRRGRSTHLDFYGSVTEYVCERKISLSARVTKTLLNTLYERATSESHDQRKGVLLEVLCAALMSQVDGFEARAKGVSNRSQQMDVLIHNRNTSGMLGDSPIVLVEARNWPIKPVAPKDYSAFLRKMETRHRRCRLGFIITTGRFTRNVATERRSDAKNDPLVILVDGKALPKIWNGRLSVSDSVESLAIEAVIGT